MTAPEKGDMERFAFLSFACSSLSTDRVCAYRGDHGDLTGECISERGDMGGDICARCGDVILLNGISAVCGGIITMEVRLEEGGESLCFFFNARQQYPTMQTMMNMHPTDPAMIGARETCAPSPGGSTAMIS